jgi:hypothetical protein
LSCGTRLSAYARNAFSTLRTDLGPAAAAPREGRWSTRVEEWCHGLVLLMCAGVIVGVGCAQNPESRFSSSEVIGLARGLQIVERTREQVVGTSNPARLEELGEDYFIGVARQDLRMECVLRRQYGMTPTNLDLESELQRIDRNTQAPSVWAAIKNALGNDRGRMKSVVCRPVWVRRRLQQRFLLDQRVHAPRRSIAESLRHLLLDGALRGGPYYFGPTPLCVSTEQGTTVPWGTDQDESGTCDGFIGPLATEAMNHFSSGMRVTPVLSDDDGFYVLRVTSMGKVPTVDGVRVPRLSLDEWLLSVSGQGCAE